MASQRWSSLCKCMASGLDAHGRIVLTEKLEELFSEAFANDDKFSYTGGVAHNVIINEALNKKFNNMMILQLVMKVTQWVLCLRIST